MRRFAFDTSFDAPDADKASGTPMLPEPIQPAQMIPEATEPETPPPPTFSADEMQAARAAAWSDGHAAGRTEAEMALTARQNRLLEALTGQLEHAGRTADSLRRSLETDAVRIGVAVVQALYPHSFREEARLEIVRAVREVLEVQENTPALLTLTIAAADQEWLTPLIAGLGSQRFRLRVQDGMAAGDFRLEWTDGGIERQQAQIWDRIRALLPKNDMESISDEQ